MYHYYVGLAVLGLFVGAFGTLIGAGGGFVLTPILLLLYPTESPAVITSISLAVVFFNSTAGTISYARMKRIDYRSGCLFAGASIPGAILGALTTSTLSRRSFDLVFGSAMGLAALVILWLAARPQIGSDAREVPEYSRSRGMAISFAAGFLSSLLGIGGGIIHVPAMVHLLGFPVHIATATSHFVLMGMSLTGTLVHIATGAFTHGLRRTAALAVGVLIGAPIGARFSNRVEDKWILRGLGVGLLAVGVRILWLAR